MTRRLLWSTPWEPARSLLTGTVTEPAALELVGLHNLSGIAGVTSTGTAWHLVDGLVAIDSDAGTDMDA